MSVIVPVVKDHRFTFNCLRAIRRRTGDEIPHEVIVVHDGSDDDTSRMLNDIEGVRICRRNSGSPGHLSACHAAAEQAAGEFLVFLRGDFQVQDGWLDSLLETFATHRDAGIVGAKIAMPDGRIREAGRSVRRDGIVSRCGRGEHVFRPEYSYLQEVDSCSADCLMIRRCLFEQVGPTCAVYKSDLYQELALSFRVKESGKRVYVQPGVLVVQPDTLGAGVNPNGGDDEVFRTDRLNFCKRRDGMVKRQPDRNEGESGSGREAAGRVFVIDARTLFYDRDSGSLRMFHMLKVLQDLGYMVTFAADTLEYLEPYTRRLQSMGTQVLYRPYTPSIKEHLKSHGRRYTDVILSRADIAEKYGEQVRNFCPGAKLIFDTVDLQFLREERKGRLENDEKRIKLAGRRKKQELEMMEMSDVTLVVSPAEKELLAREAPHVRVEVVSNILPVCGRAASFEARRDILFVGNFIHPPNVDAMVYFVRDVMPLIGSRTSGIRLHIVGSNTSSAIRKLAADDVVVKGYVRDLAPLFNSIRLFVAPLRYGAGVKGKMNMSMSYGVPVVATRCAAEGMNLTDGKDVLIADDADSFADAVVRLYGDQRLWNRLSEGGMENVRSMFSFDAAGKQLKAILEA